MSTTKALAVMAISHRQAPLALLEQVNLDAQGCTALARTLVDIDGVSEAVVLSTCNRTEVYLAGHTLDLDAALAALVAQTDADLLRARHSRVARGRVRRRPPSLPRGRRTRVARCRRARDRRSGPIRHRHGTTRPARSGPISIACSARPSQSGAACISATAPHRLASPNSDSTQHVPTPRSPPASHWSWVPG